MAFVLDASIAIAWVVHSQANTYAKRIRLRAMREPFHVPCIFLAEVANVLVVLERRGILTGAGADAAADVLSA
jgi:predicted nucleic acid-binding protein